MRKWEYEKESFTDWDNPMPRLAELGHLGWQLVAALREGEETTCYYFRRPISWWKRLLTPIDRDVSSAGDFRVIAGEKRSTLEESTPWTLELQEVSTGLRVHVHVYPVAEKWEDIVEAAAKQAREILAAVSKP